MGGFQFDSETFSFMDQVSHTKELHLMKSAKAPYTHTSYIDFPQRGLILRAA